MFLHGNAVVHRVSAALAPEIALTFNPLGARFRWAVQMQNTRPGDTVVTLGPGHRGLTSVIAFREAGAGTIVVTGLKVDADKHKIATAFGADHSIEVDNEDAVERVPETTVGRGADVVVEFSA